MKIILSTSNAYSHVLRVAVWLFNKNWGVDQQVEIVGYDKPSFDLPDNFTFYSMGEQIGGPKNFSTDLRKYFEKQSDYFMIWMMDDTFVRAIDKEKLELLKRFCTKDAGRLNLCSRATKLQDHLEKDGVLENTQTADYRLCTQPSIWNKEFLLKYMTPGLTPWQFETQKAVNDGYRIIGLKEEVLTHNEGVTKHDIYKLNLKGINPEQIKEMQKLHILPPSQSTRDKILEKYLKVCKAAAEDDSVFAAFKSHPYYKEVLEHCSEKIGRAHLDNIRASNPWLLVINQFWRNDKVGNPHIVNFGTVKASPTTLQYISVLSNIVNLFGTLKGMRIAEIGGGYGGQAKIIQDVFDVAEYDIIDLYEATLLIERYLEEYKVKTYTNENYEIKEYDLFISNYALTEVSSEDQLKYVQDICLNCTHGYITANQALNGIDLLKEKFEVTISKDITGERETNYLITW